MTEIVAILSSITVVFTKLLEEKLKSPLKKGVLLRF